MLGNEAAGAPEPCSMTPPRTARPTSLTAHHCISDAAVGLHLHALWDYDAPSCGGAVAALSSLPQQRRGNAARDRCRRATSVSYSLTSAPSGALVHGLGLPGPRRSVPAGTTIYRLSHPTSTRCPPSPLPHGIQSRGRSSEFRVNASPVKIGLCVFGAEPGLCVYGQLRIGRPSGRRTGGRPGNGRLSTRNQCACTDAFDLLDGAFSTTYPFIARWLDAPSPTYVPDPATLCLSQRFQVTALWNKA